MDLLENGNYIKIPDDLTGDEVVISGISGIYPKSGDVQEFMDNLYNKVDMITSSTECWPFMHPEMPQFCGRVPDYHSFDAQFFRVPYAQGHTIDSMTRKLLENSYGAFFDAGISPGALTGTKLGVFIGTSFTDVFGTCIFDNCENTNRYVITGSCKSMQANRISYWIDGKGPSYGIDLACASSIVALEHAVLAIKSGLCSSAIVGGANYFIEPRLSLNLRKAGLLCLDGKTKCFDKNADGYVRSEAVSVLFLQKASDARRIYAEVVHSKSKSFMAPDDLFLPSRESAQIEKLLHEFYSEVKVSPNDVEYIEACGAGIAQADINELTAISNIFANDHAIKVGCVKSNMGHSEGASGACSITKLCLAYHKGSLPANLHYEVPHDDLPGVRDGRVQVVTENMPFSRGYTALNLFSNCGMNNHTLSLKGHYKKKDLQRYSSSIPRLVLVSGRIDDSIKKIFDTLKSQPLDAEVIGLLHGFFENDISGHTSRGYIILVSDENNKPVCVAESTCLNPGVKSPVWFFYSGMGSQWSGMGAELMKIPTFAASIERCNNVLKPKGIDLIRILTHKDEAMFDNILHSFVGIAAVQIALTDLLKEMGIVPDNIIGHSLGENICAYVDGCLTVEETILAAYYRGVVSVETKFVKCLMAAVGLGHKKVLSLCPPEIEVACHNSPDSTTISGPADAVEKFVEELNSKNIFAKTVQSSNIAYHSKYIADAGPRFKSILKDLIKTPKLRSEKWISSSAPQDQWDQDDVKYASAEYFTNNMLSCVLFEEAAKNIPVNAIIIEIAPHGLMQAIMKRSHETCTNIPLTRRGHSNPVNFLLEAVGKLYQAGLNPKVDILYPKVEFPVSTETSLLSPIVGWAHDEEWSYLKFTKGKTKRISVRNFAITLEDEEWKYIKGHKRNGTIVFPEAAFIFLVWETLAVFHDMDYNNMSVNFESIRFEKELFVRNNELLRFTVSLQMGSKRFEIYQDDVQIVSGIVNLVEKDNTECTQEVYIDYKDYSLSTQDIYTGLAKKGYTYKDNFQSILSTNKKYTKANIKWTDWITFIDSMIQLSILSRDHVGVSVPKYIKRLTIDTKLHEHTLPSTIDDIVSYNAEYNDIFDTTRCAGVEIYQIVLKAKPIFDQTLAAELIPVSINVSDQIIVVYAGLSLYDYQNIISKGKPINTCGMDFSGYNVNGEKVMGLVPGSALTSMVTPDPRLTWPVPDHWSLQDAASVPLQYAMAYYCLIIRGGLQANGTVLVLGAAGALGQAVISVALAINCTVFAAVSSYEKKLFLLRKFPGLKDEHILEYSNSDPFSFFVSTAHHTNNLLCDCVVSCATGEIRQQAMKCVGNFGKFLDVNTHDAIENMDFNMSYCWGGRSYVAVNLSTIFKPEYEHQKKLIHQLISEGISRGVVTPLSRVVYSSTDITNAFRHLALNTRTGKVLIKMADTRNKQNIENIECSRIDCISRTEYDEIEPICKYEIDVINQYSNDSITETQSKLLIEQQFKYSYNNMTTYDSKKNENGDIVKEIYDVIGITKSDVDEHEPFANLNISEICLEEIRHVINKQFNIDYSKDELRRLTLARLKDLQREPTKGDKVDGLRAFINYIENDVIQASEPIVQMSTKIASYNTDRTTEFDSHEPHLIMVPGFEGQSRIFTSISERLKIPAVTLQLAPDLEGEDIPTMAQNLFKYIKRTFVFNSKFYILGYSFGVNIALELAALLEKEGHLGVVFCLDSSPNAVRHYLDTYLGKLSEKELQNVIINEIYRIITGEYNKMLKEELEKKVNWSEKVDIALKIFRPMINFPREYIQAVIEAMYKRIKLSKQYKPNIKLESKIVLIKSALHDNNINFVDYDLSKHTNQPVTVIEIESDHITAPYNSQVSNIVNSMLDSQILELFNKTNQCEVYNPLPTVMRATPTRRTD